MRRRLANVKSVIDCHLDSNIQKKLAGRWSMTRPIDPDTGRPIANKSFKEQKTRRILDGNNLSQSVDFRYTETRETFKRIAHVNTRSKGKDGRHKKTGNMSTEPESAGMAQRLSANRRSKLAVTAHTTHAHIDNVVSMYRRMEHANSLTERKKNHFDPTLYPTFIRRRCCEQAPSALVRTSLNPHTSAFSEYTTYRTANLSRGTIADKTIPKYRPNSAPPLKPRKFLEAEERAREEVPAHVKDIYDQMYSDIMEEIIEGRVYKEPALRKLFRRFVLDHCGQLEDVAMRVVDDVKDELDVRD
eukprot:CAMPEP_0198212282 /NCGR_PEP_ID=MMETSP1445-20131203/25626_1 /TAXON_ID=36898 /ORGANISM="Pyramimonas sp., Strain CCMP2087" /LENGTH=300 /DNA_ID=CAMNT_0043886691 /DNA_START=292 /DNA_END=1194 /DNA_ORIENTATION=-